MDFKHDPDTDFRPVDALSEDAAAEEAMEILDEDDFEALLTSSGDPSG